MRRNVLVFGSISGIISSIWVLLAMTALPEDMHMSTGMILGYTSMIIANIFLVVGVKNYRDKYNGGFITFGKALGVGLLIALLGATFYVVTWLIYFYASGTDFMEVYTQSVLADLEKSGASPAVIAQQAKEMKEFMIMYQNPFFNAAITYMEILPVSLLFAFITALIMKRKPKNGNPSVLDVAV